MFAAIIESSTHVGELRATIEEAAADMKRAAKQDVIWPDTQRMIAVVLQNQSLPVSEVCWDCHRINPVWFAPNDLWNKVIPEQTGILCPLCFIRRAEARDIVTTGWMLCPETLAEAHVGELREALVALIPLIKECCPGVSERLHDRIVRAESVLARLPKETQ